ncbi:MAG: SDR family NAD(P)-dependent oxidoreductase, partial [Xanthomarina sp.]
MKISSKIAIVTGASSGLGAAISNVLIKNGATVYGVSRSEDKLHDLAKKLGEGFISSPLDVSDSAAVKTWMSKTFFVNHSPDILINNAGVGSFAPIDETGYDAW